MANLSGQIIFQLSQNSSLKNIIVVYEKVALALKTSVTLSLLTQETGWR